MQNRCGTFIAIAAVLTACSRGGDADSTSGVRLPPGGPDPIVVRAPIAGGPVRAYLYPKLDSIAWRSAAPAPPLGSLLAFDAENGTMAFVDATGIPGWIDFRVGSVRRATAKPLSLIASSEGSAIFGVNNERHVVRYTPTGEWTQELDGRIRKLFPQPDGSLIVLVQGDKTSNRLLRFRPPESEMTDSVTLATPQRSTNTSLGDRVYFAIGEELVGISTGDFSTPFRVKASDEVLAIAPTPSGDRIYLATKGEKALDVVDRYSASVSGQVRLGGFITELRMDRLGRYLLARPVEGDSVWVVAIATGTLVGTVRTEWRTDLPFVAPDGAIATLRGADVDFVDPVSGKSMVRAEGGAADVWHIVLWNGLRPRASGLDRKVLFQTEGGAPSGVTDSAAATGTRDTVAVVPLVPPRVPNETAREPEPLRETPRQRGFTVSFAAVLSEEKAHDLAREIRVDGVNARVVIARTDGTSVYRVVLGPYASRADADRVGRESRHSYWIIEGPP
ncbi:MAG: SPOR domain-containing protein [Gemmatimonadaceae bacterium]